MDDRKKVTAREVYDLLVDEFKIKEKKGSVEIKIGGISAKYESKDALGDLIQEWLGQFLKNNNIYYQDVTNTQDFPDFLLTEHNDKGLLEIKTFNGNAGPAFDIANFNSYNLSLLERPERLDADYLVFSYMMEEGEFSIKDVWLKKVWELSGTSSANPITLQTKYKQPYNLRPVTWYSTRGANKSFKNRLEFVQALAETQAKYKNHIDNYDDEWLDKVKKAYKLKTEQEL